MITINATSDTTLHTAGKYCEEDILVKVPTGGGEDVTEETNAYTEKLVALETAITALETELEGKAAGGGGIPEFSTVRIYLKDVHLSDYYTFVLEWDEVALYCYYIDSEYKIRNELLIQNHNTDTMEKSEVIFTVPTNSTIILEFTRMMHHYIDDIVSSAHNELHDINTHFIQTWNGLSGGGGRLNLPSGSAISTVPIWGNTEIRISESDN